MTCLSIIFDLDGTLLDTLTDLADTCNELLREHEFPTHPTVAYKDFVGDGLQTLIKRIVPIGTEAILIEKCCASFKKRYSRNWKRNSCPYPGINDMVAALKMREMKLAVLSNKPEAFTKLFVDEFFRKGQFAIVHGQREGVPKKPDPTVALAIAAQLNVRPQETLFVGDSGVDIQTGKAADMLTAGVSWGFRSVQELTENNADIVVHNPLELQQYVLSFT